MLHENMISLPLQIPDEETNKNNVRRNHLSCGNISYSLADKYQRWVEKWKQATILWALPPLIRRVYLKQISISKHIKF